MVTAKPAKVDACNKVSEAYEKVADRIFFKDEYLSVEETRELVKEVKRAREFHRTNKRV